MSWNPHRLLEHIVNEVRNREVRHEGETIDDYLKRTWQQALEQHEHVKAERLLRRDASQQKNGE